jgi:hypothetical protein
MKYKSIFYSTTQIHGPLISAMEINNQIKLYSRKCLKLFNTKHFGAGAAHVGGKSMPNVQNKSHA